MITLIDTAETKIAIYTEDPAILMRPEDDDEARGTTQAQLDEYRKTLDSSLLTMVDGSRPTEFVIRALDGAEDRRNQARALRASTGDGDKAMALAMLEGAFLAGCTSVRNLRRRGDNVEMTEAIAAKIPSRIVYEIGGHIITLGSDSVAPGSERGDNEKK